MTRQRHLCHARNCDKLVPRKMFMCKAHWSMVPKDLQRKIWAEYQPGQEQLQVLPSEEYLAVTREARDVVARKEAA